MALTFTHVAAANIADTVARTSYASPSFTPSADKLYLLAACWSPQTASGGQVGTPTSTTGLTFVSIVSNIGYESNAFALGLWRAMKPSGLSAGTYTIPFAGGNRTGCCAFLVEVQGMVTTGTDGEDAIGNMVGNTGGGTTPTVNLSFASAANGVFAIGSTSNRTAPSATNLTALIGGDPDITSPDQQVFGAYKDGNETDPTFTITSDFWGMIAVEIIAAGGGGGGGNRRRRVILGAAS